MLVCEIKGGIGIFGFALLPSVCGFCAYALRFFGFGVRFGLRIFRFSAFDFRFSSKILKSFRIWYLMWFLFDLSGK